MTHEIVCSIAQGFSIGVVLSWVLDYFFPRPRRKRYPKLKVLTGNAFRENMKKVLGVELCPVCNGTVGEFGCKVCNGAGVI
jgi:hypothetical protein